MKPKKLTLSHSLDKANCILFLSQKGYEVNSSNEQTIVFKKSGTIFTFSGKYFPKELTLSIKDKQADISLKYDAFVLFDTGDLQKELNQIANELNQSVN